MGSLKISSSCEDMVPECAVACRDIYTMGRSGNVVGAQVAVLWSSVEGKTRRIRLKIAAAARQESIDTLSP